MSQLNGLRVIPHRPSMALVTLCLYFLVVGQLWGQAPSDPLPIEKASRQFVMSASQDGEKYELRLDLPVTPMNLSGIYRRGTKGLRFQSNKTPTSMYFAISTLAGRQLYEVKQSDDEIRSSILGEPLLRFDLALLKVARDEKRRGRGPHEIPGITVEGSVAVEEYLAIPELSLLPHLSKILGQELGYTGTTYPAALPLHVMALSVSKRIRATTNDLGTHTQTTAPSNKAACEPYPFPNNGCYGMCGPGCTCWSWVCGDCCFHTGCAVHDDYCRTFLGFAHPWCIDFYIPFLIGGGC
jgi:hypothetical protein